jgi:soluble lytic murein transglycosylase-like protein
MASPPSDLDAMIRQAAAQHQIDPDLIRAIVRVESNFNPNAVSPAGAHGLMQLIPATAQRFGVSNSFDPRANLDGGIRYLKHLLGLYKGDLQLSLAAYNAGENSVARFRGVPAYPETQNYIRKIDALYPMRSILTGYRPIPKIMKFVDAAGVVHFSNTDVP